MAGYQSNQFKKGGRPARGKTVNKPIGRAKPVRDNPKDTPRTERMERRKGIPT